MWKPALKIWAMTETSRWGRFFKTDFGIPFGPIALLILRPIDIIENFDRVGKLGFAGKGQEVRPESHVKLLINRMICQRLKSSFQTVCKASSFSES